MRQLTATLALLLFVASLANTAHAAVAYDSPRYSKSTHYPIGSHKIRFIARTVGGVDFNKDSLAEVAQAYKNEAQQENRKSHIWDDNWYRVSLPEQYSEYLIIIAHDITANKWAWVAVKNTPSRWIVLDSKGTRYYPRNGQNVKITRYFNGHRIDFDIRNPEKWDSSREKDHGLFCDDTHIFYSFGY